MNVKASEDRTLRSLNHVRFPDILPNQEETVLEPVDAVVIGAGYNGLICAAYLATSGLEVKVLERRDVLGEACATEELSLDQLFFLRPAAGYADYRSPIQGLYQCGSSTDLGGGAMGVCGYNAAREILKDWRP